MIVICKQEHRKRWKLELTKKFGLDICSIGDREQYQENIVLLSYSEMSKYKEVLSRIEWGLIVFDNAHELIAGYHSGNMLENEIGTLCRGKKKILLTATPMNNSLIDLYYLVHILDPTLFGGSEVLFKKKYIAHSNVHSELVRRVQMLCQRTLRRQVKTMQFTRRIVKTILITPSQEEVVLSTKMSEYFHRDVLLAFLKIKEVYIRLIFWKLLASSLPALISGFDKAKKRLQGVLEGQEELAELNSILIMQRILHRVLGVRLL